jgi:phage terminase large subunit-like protein
MVTAVKSSVTLYAESVGNGDVLTGQLVKLACQRHLDDLEHGHERGLYFDEEAAQDAIGFFPLLKQSKGRWANAPLVLQPWQAFIVGSIFGWKRADGLRRFRRAYVEVARKNGKSTLAAGIGLMLAFFDGESGAEVYAAATKRDQAKIVWSEAHQMVLRTLGLKQRIKDIPSRANLHMLPTASKFEALGADNDSLDGLNVHGAIVDELHAHKTRYVVDILETATGAREQPLFFYITTAGVARESIYTETHEYARRVVEGFSDDGWFVYIAKLDEEDSWLDDTKYIKANPSLGVTLDPAELIQERDRAIEIPGRQNPFRRLRLDEQTEQVDRWLDMGVWDEGGAPIDLESLKGRACYGGLDLSSTTDLTALVLAFPQDDGALVWLCWCWVPRDNIQRRADRDRVPYPLWVDQGYITATPGNVVDYDQIRVDINELNTVYNVREIAIDRWNSSQLTTQLMGDGFTMVPFGQGFASMTAPTKEVEKLVLGRTLRHLNNPVLRWAASNVAVLQDPAGNLKPDKSKSTERIDPMVAGIMATGRAMVQDDGTSYYNDHELRVI